ncbi:ATP-binding protein [Pseudoflavitalea rhizosphaerae]|uniref:ATP-binding protein n=1 Tax=Pseudoflavitalea rhizosphaerae TaxID=1884793 RepID=UPI000F8E4708|nr:ATP-binding protein [Pseudoflavitalea rhizosphaerae]
MQRGDALQILKDHLSKPQHTILVGPRQVGKTTLVKQLSEILTKQKEINYFISFEDLTILRTIDEHPENIFNYTLLPSEIPEGKKLYIIIDEVQYANNPSNFLKLLYDKYHDSIKIIATGSSGFYIDKSFKDSLAGRKKVFEIYPLSFDEYLHFKQEDDLITELQQIRKRKTYTGLQKIKIDILFDEYIVYGGYPAVVLASNIDEKQEILKELVNSYMKKDALEAGVKEEYKFFQLARILAEQSGNQVNHHEIGNTLQMSGHTVDNYVYLLQKSFIIQLLRPMFGNLRKEITKMPKVYYNDTGLRNALLNNFNNLNQRLDKGPLLENYVYTRLRDLYTPESLRYWRTSDGSEVDFVIEQSLHKGLAYEVKYNDALYKASKYYKFMEAYPGFPLSVISKEAGKEETQEVIRL